MLDENKPEFPPLFPPGFHDVTLDCLEKTFVEPFANNSRRAYLVERLHSLFRRLESVKLPAEIWLDGSFVTHKEEPDDIDLIIYFEDKDLTNLTSEQVYIINELNDRALSQIRYNCDVFIVRKDDVDNRSYWRGWFCFTRKEEPKGVARIWYNSNGNQAA